MIRKEIEVRGLGRCICRESQQICSDFLTKQMGEMHSSQRHWCAEENTETNRLSGLLHSRKTLGLVGVTALSQMNLIQPFLEMSSSH